MSPEIFLVQKLQDLIGEINEGKLEDFNYSEDREAISFNAVIDGQEISFYFNKSKSTDDEDIKQTPDDSKAEDYKLAT